jgi:hypothetical protein
MKTIIFFFASLFMIPLCQAGINDSLANSNPKKNEIGMILNPVGIVLLGAQPTGQRIGMMYKRNFKTPNIYFTTGVYYQGFSNNINRDHQLTLALSGASRNIQYSIESNNRALLSFGVEKRWTISQCPAIVTYLGLEYLMSYGVENSNIGSQWIRTDTIQGIESGIHTVDVASDFIQNKRVVKTTIGGGVQINAGIQLHLNKRFYLFVQTAPSLMLSAATREEEDIINNSTVKYKASQFDFDMRALVSDIGLSYKF